MYGTDVGVETIETDTNTGTMRLRLLVSADHISASGTLDEGLVATITDNHSTYLLIAHSLAHAPEQMPISVSVCLTVHVMARIVPGTTVEIVCSAPPLEAQMDQPQASAVFVDARDPRIVYARATHTKQFKDVMGFSEFVERVNRSYTFTNQFLYYGIEIRPQITWASAAAGEFIAEWLVTSEHINAAGCIDEGCLGTVTDNTTAMLIGSLLGARGNSVSTSISIQALTPIRPNTRVEIVCRLSSQSSKQPHATATFKDKCDGRVYAIGSHTKFFKAGLSETQPRL
ncbi:hypothetical protein LPJ70_001481 [Coemansia sp. RSA 2708]|nr:hypothetical protein LPJ70_001481 [Coemansia sp. RSA 2708]